MKKALFILLLAAATGCHKKSEFVVPEPEGDRVAVEFVLPGVFASAKPASRADAPQPMEPVELAVGTTVRVLAFQRAAGAVSADITADKCVAEATYVVEEKLEDDGTKNRVLVACNVNPATGAVDNANTADPAQIRLRADKYDFYALTPATAIASPWEVSVNHGVDHASSCTDGVDGTGIAVAPNVSGAAPVYTQSVELDMLERKCSQVSFSVDRKSENVKKVVIKSVKLTEIAPEPAVAKLCEALPLPAVNNGSFEMKGTIFSAVDGKDYQFAGKEGVWPKSKAKFGLSMTVEFNDSGKETILDAPVEAMPEWAFEPNLQYCFVLTLKGGAFVLSLEVLPWDTEWKSDLEIGGWPRVPVELGDWAVDYWSDPTLGAGVYPVFGDGSGNAWTANPDLDMTIGGKN